MATAILTALGSLGAVTIAGITGWLTARASGKSAERATQATSMTELEREAGVRTADYYKKALDDCRAEYDEEHKENATLRAIIKAFRAEVEGLESALATCHATCRSLERRSD